LVFFFSFRIGKLEREAGEGSWRGKLEREAGEGSWRMY
jgi:hypothetical protein